MGWKKQPSNQTGLTWTDFLEAALSRQCLQVRLGPATSGQAMMQELQHRVIGIVAIMPQNGLDAKLTNRYSKIRCSRHRGYEEAGQAGIATRDLCSGS